MAVGGNNPIKYSDIFDLQDKQVINELIDNLNLVDKEYQQLVSTFQQGSKTMKDSFVSAANDMAEALKRLTLAQQADRDAMLQLAQAAEELRNKQKTWNETQANATNAVNNAADSVNGLKQRIKDLTDEYNRLSKSDAAEKSRMEEIVKETQALKKEQKELVDAMKLARTQTEYMVGSYKALEEQTKQMLKELKEMPNAFDKSNAAGQELIKRIKENTDTLKQYDAMLGIHNRNVGDYKKALEGVGSEVKAFGISLAATLLGFESLSELLKKIVQDNLEVSDSLAEVRRTAGLTAASANMLAENLKEIDTRTTLKGLLDLAKIGAQLGFDTVPEIEGFTKAIDQLAVALSGEIEGGAEAVATAIGKINGVFKTRDKEGTDVETSFLKTGSAILKLGQVGLATGEYLQDFTLRVAAVSAQAGISLPVMLAYGSTLEEAGISAEVAGTAISQLITRMAKAPQAFYAVAKAADPKLTLKQFVDFINNDTKTALDLFFRGLNEAGQTTTEFNRILGSLHLQGQRVNSTVQTLAQNQEILAKRVSQATEAYKEGTLATDQFKIKNENLAAAFEKVYNSITNAFVNSGLADAIAKGINAIASNKTEVDKLSDAYTTQKKELDNLEKNLPPLIKRYDELKAKAKDLGGEAKLTKDEQKELNDVIQNITSIVPEATKSVNQYGEALDITRGKIGMLTQEMRENVKIANREAAEKNREAIKEYQEQIKREQEAIAKGGALTNTNRMDITVFFKSRKELIEQSKEEIAFANIMISNLVKGLKTKLQQDLTPEEQNIYDRFFGKEADAKKAEEGVKKVAEETGKADEVIKNIGASAAKAKTQIEILEEQVKKFKDQLESQAISGKVSKDTLDKYISAVHQLEEAQRIATKAVTEAIDPFAALRNEIQFLTEKLQREIGLGQDTAQTMAELSDATGKMQVMQDDLQISLASTTGQMQLLNAQLQIYQRDLQQDIATGNDYTDNLEKVVDVTKQLAQVQRTMNIAVLMATDPLAGLSAQADEFKRILSEQAAQGQISAESVDKYREAMDALSAAQERFKKATKYNPLDPAGLLESADLQLERNEQDSNLVKGGAEAGDRNSLRRYQQLQAARLQITLGRLNAEQLAYEEGSKEWEEIETKKTQVLYEQERLRTENTKAEADKRSEIIQQGIDLLNTGVTGFYQLQQREGENELTRLQKQKEKELQLAGNNAVAQDAINKKYAQKEAEIKRKQAEQAKIAALFNIAINTAQGATKAVAEFPLTGGMPFLAFVLAQGALQAGLVAATPIPEYWRGRNSGPAEYAWLGERGPEAVQKRDGSVYMTKGKAHIGYLESGDKVFPAHSAETKMYKSLFNYNSTISDTEAANKAYSFSASSILNARQGYDVYTAAKAIKMAGMGISITALQQAFGAALDERPAHMLSLDAEGIRTYEIRKNQRIENLNNRNSFGGKG